MSKFKWTKEQLIQAVKNNLSIAGVCRELNLRPIGGNYKTIHYYIKEYNLDTSHFTGQGWNVGTRYKNIRTKRPIEDILSGKVECRSSFHLKIRLLKEGIKEHKCEKCGNSKWLGQEIPLELHHINGDNLDTSHFTGQGWNVGLRYKPIMNPKTYKLEDILIKDSPYRSLSKLKIRLISEGIKENRCECCNNTMWLGKPIKLELHHINGINTDNRLENLQLLCPNCHAYTDNYRGRNQESALSKKREVEYRKVKEALTDNADGNLEPSLIKEGAETIYDKPKF